MTNKTRIVRGDVDLDLYPDEVIAKTLQGPNIGDLTTRGFNFTNTFKIPAKTKVNQESYENANQINSLTTVPYTQERIKIIQNGIEVESNGKESIKGSTDESYDIAITSGAIGFFDVLGDLLLSDLDDFVIPTGDIAQTALRNATSGVVYPVAYYGKSGGVDRFVGFPYVYDLSILNSIIDNAGYIGEGSIFTNPKFIKTVTGAFYNQNGYVSPFIENRRVSVSVATPQVIALANVPGSLIKEINFTGVSEGGTNPFGYWDGTSRYLMNDPRLPIDRSLYYIKAGVNINITVPVGCTVDLYMNSVATFGNLGSVIATNVGSGTYSLEDDEIQFFNGEYFYIRIDYKSSPGFTPFNVTVNFGSLEIQPTPNPLGFTFGFAPTLNLYDDIAALLPNIKQKDFIKDIMIIYGLIATEKNGVITFTSFDEIIADKSNALDWTLKRVPDKTRDKLTYTPYSYGQNNIFRYSNNDPLITTDYGLGSFTVANENIQPEKEIYRSIYAAARTSYLNNLIVADVNLYDDSGYDFPAMFNKASNRKLLVRDKYSSEPAVTYMDGIAYSDYKAVYFDDPNQSDSMKFQQFLDQNYPLFIEALQLAKVANYSYMLTEIDIAGFDFLKLVFDKDSYFLVIRISNYISGIKTAVQQFKVL